MGTSPSETIKEAFAQLAQYQTENATEMSAFLAQQPEMWTEIGASIMAFADRMGSDMPYGGVSDCARDLGAGVGGLALVAEGLSSAFRVEYAEKIGRIEGAGEPDERQWDISAQ